MSTEPDLPFGAVPPAPLRLHCDLEALVANWRALDRLSGAASAGAAVKADAYGAGARRVAPALLGAGCRDFFVAHWQEAAELLALVPAPALAMLHGPLTAAEAQWARATGVRPVLNSLTQVDCWLAAGGGPCHVMVDTGMNRLGLPMAALGDPRLAALEIDVLLSHLAAAEDETELNARQQERWMAARQRLPHRRASLANSAGIMLGADYHGDLTRPGLALYGGVPCAALAPHIRQVVRPEAAILQVREIAAGDTVGYNATFTATGPMRIGVIALGYADGFLRCWSGKGAARGDSGAGAVLPVLGRVSMDMTVIDLGAAPALREGDWVSLDYALPQAAELTGLSQYELLTALGRRFAR
ncbi:alanine racemase [Novosphingobium bradum]|uniref:Alanine racemase n=1 Tax=Novosphingobium bradum TaxID=1737444 RepID=A0ABV7IUN2_9SPHN